MRYEIEGKLLSDIGDAIREKTGKSGLILPGDMPGEIKQLDIPGGGENVIESRYTPAIDNMNNGDVVITLSEEVITNEKYSVATPVAGIAGQNAASAINALNAAGSNNGNVFTWTTQDRNYSDLWIGADYGSPILLNAVTLAPRTHNFHRQIWTTIMEGSNDTISWVEIGIASLKGDEIPHAKWYTCVFTNKNPYRYYRIRTTLNPDTNVINYSVTFTLYGLGFLYEAGNGIYTNAYYKINNELIKFTNSPFTET